MLIGESTPIKSISYAPMMSRCSPDEYQELGVPGVGSMRPEGQRMSCPDLLLDGQSIISESSRNLGRRRRHPSTPTSSVLIVLVLTFLACSPLAVEAFVSRLVLSRLPDGRVRAYAPSAGRCTLSARLSSQGERRRFMPFVSSVLSGSDGRGGGVGVALGTRVAPRMVTAAATPGCKAKEDILIHKDKRKRSKSDRLRVTTPADFRRLLSEGKSLTELDVRGDSQELLESREDEHPVLELLRKRVEAGTQPGSHGDGFKVCRDFQ